MQVKNFEEFMKDIPKVPSRLSNMVKIASGKLKPEIAQSEHEVIAEWGRVRLLKFHAKEEKGHSPILLVPSIINKYYIFDLQPGKSIVEHLVGEGITTYVIDWGNPGPQDRYRTLGDHILKWLHAAVRKSCRDAGQSSIHLLGYCVGGTFATVYTVLRPERVQSLVCLSTPIRFHDEGILSCWASSKAADLVKLQQTYGNIPQELLQNSFQLLIPTSSLLKPMHFAHGVWDKEFSQNFLALEAWLNDNVDFPGASYIEYITKFYQENQLEKGELEINGEKVDLKNIDCPVLSLIATKDHIVPPCSSKILHEKISSKKQEIEEYRSGHIGITIGRRAKDGMWKKLSDWVQTQPNPSKIH